MGCMSCDGGKKKQAPRSTPQASPNPSRQLYSPKKNIVGYAGVSKPRIKMSSRGR